MIDPSTIVPSNKLQHQVYYFKVLITAKGGASFTTLEFTLDVGCTPTLVITESASFVASISLNVGDSASAVYTYAPPDTSRIYC